jgi:hypothetical protein
MWLDGGCPVCSKVDRNGTTYACNGCFDGLSAKDNEELMKELQNAGQW